MGQNVRLIFLFVVRFSSRCRRRSSLSDGGVGITAGLLFCVGSVR